MTAQRSKERRRGFSLPEALVLAALVIALLTVVCAFMVAGQRYSRETESFAFVQREATSFVRRLSDEMSNSVDRWVEYGPSHVIFLSPSPSDGGRSVEFDASSGHLLWKKWVCYFASAGDNTIRRAEIPLDSPTADLASQPEPIPTLAGFEARPSTVVARSVKAFSVSGAGLASYAFSITVFTTASVSATSEQARQVEVTLASQVTLLNKE